MSDNCTASCAATCTTSSWACWRLRRRCLVPPGPSVMVVGARAILTTGGCPIALQGRKGRRAAVSVGAGAAPALSDASPGQTTAVVAAAALHIPGVSILQSPKVAAQPTRGCCPPGVVTAMGSTHPAALTGIGECRCGCQAFCLLVVSEGRVGQRWASGVHSCSGAWWQAKQLLYEASAAMNSRDCALHCLRQHACNNTLWPFAAIKPHTCPCPRHDWQQPHMPRVAAARRNNGEHQGRAQPLAETITVTTSLCCPALLAKISTERLAGP